MQETVKNRELVSALVDGQLSGDEFARTVECLAQSDDARSSWDVYHVVGDVLRSGETMVSARDAAFVQRLRLSLQQDTPRRPEVIDAKFVASNDVLTREYPENSVNKGSANDERFRWKLLAGVASLAAVLFVGWYSIGGDQHGAPQLGQVNAPLSNADNPPLVMIRDPQLDALLAAHKQFGGMSALQVPAGFLRNATFEGATR